MGSHSLLCLLLGGEAWGRGHCKDSGHTRPVSAATRQEQTVPRVPRKDSGCPGVGHMLGSEMPGHMTRTPLLRVEHLQAKRAPCWSCGLSHTLPPEADFVCGICHKSSRLFKGALPPVPGWGEPGDEGECRDTVVLCVQVSSPGM